MGSKTLLKTLAGCGAIALIGGWVVSSNAISVETEEKIEPIPYSVRTTLDANMPIGTEEVKQKGKNGSKKIVYRVEYKGGKEVGRKKQTEKIVESPVDEEIVMGNKVATPQKQSDPRTYTPAPGPSAGVRSGAICRDGTRSNATGRGACSHHGGVDHWI